jgi:protein TonB
MGSGYQGLDEPWNSRGAWGWLGSVLVHVLIVAAVLLTFREKPSRPRVVVPMETVTLVPSKPGLKGGGGRPAPVSRPEPVPPKPAPTPLPPKPRVKPKPQIQPKPVPPPPDPTKTPVIPAPSPPAFTTKASPAPPSAVTSQARTSQGTTGISGTGQGGQGGGRGAGSGGGVGTGQGRSSGGGSALQGYLREIRRLLEKHKEYPWAARQRHIQGVVVVRFAILADGQIESSQISRSSGQDLLDEAAQNTIRRVGKFSPFPAELNRQNLTIEVPLAFRLTTE